MFAVRNAILKTVLSYKSCIVLIFQKGVLHTFYRCYRNSKTNLKT